MKTIQVTQEEIRMATRPNVYRNKKKYTRKDKSWKKDYLNTLLFILMFGFSFSQTNTSYLVENSVTNNSQTVEVDNYNQQYDFYIQKSYRQKNVATWIGALGGIAASVGYGYYSDNPRMVKGMVFATILTSCVSTTFYISSSVNRKRAYQLKRKTYL